MLDYLIVGFGLAGVSFSEQLLQHDKSFVVLSEETKSSSVVAGGMYNPVILKRFTSPWNAIPQHDYALPFFKAIEQRLNCSVLNPMSVLRVFTDAEEQNNWLIASDKPNLAPFLSSNFITNTNHSILAHSNFGEVLHAGRLNVANLLSAYKADLLQKSQYYNHAFEHSQLQVHDDHVSYNDLKAKHVVFAEGFGMLNNPYFNYLPLNGTKGEVLIIESEELNLSAIVKSSVFIIPYDQPNQYLVGATYHWTDKTWQTTNEAKEELLSKLNTLITCDYKVVDQKAGIRPTVKDRRPLVGQHPKYKNLHVLNGMGTRGVMVAPLMSKHLFDAIENGVSLDTEIDCSRFAELYS
ncbi:MAG: NAD(P)/FAD-dependent oxidoreductase [Flavobacteriaceae bacterium]